MFTRGYVHLFQGLSTYRPLCKLPWASLSFSIQGQPPGDCCLLVENWGRVQFDSTSHARKTTSELGCFSPGMFRATLISCDGSSESAPKMGQFRSSKMTDLCVCVGMSVTVSDSGNCWLSRWFILNNLELSKHLNTNGLYYVYIYIKYYKYIYIY